MPKKCQKNSEIIFILTKNRQIQQILSSYSFFLENLKIFAKINGQNPRKNDQIWFILTENWQFRWILSGKCENIFKKLPKNFLQMVHFVYFD